MNTFTRLSLPLLLVASCKNTSPAKDSESKTTSAAFASVVDTLDTSIVTLGTLAGTAQCVDIPFGSAEPGINLQEHSCNSAPAQMFRFSKYPDGNWRILSVITGLCVEVEGASVANRAPIQTSSCNGSNAQKFTLNDRGDGTIGIMSALSKKCFDIDGEKPNDGTAVQQWDCLNNKAQSFRPIPIPRPLRIMPLGASITQGIGGTKAGTRGYLHSLLENARFPHRFVGSSTEQPGDLPADQRNHEGHPGWTIDDIPGRTSGITPRAAAWVREANPDFILILLGNNDIGNDFQVDQMGARMKRLIEIINNPATGAAPYARILIATLPLINDKAQEDKALAYGGMIRLLVAEMKAAHRNIDVVDIHSVVTLADKTDNFHPNDSGHSKIAKMWFDKLLGQP